uniref:Uncharacterized protein n=1 Tax=viral metagenome TaxID=1070528 RepID=A0A6M3J3B7_9ZZZZ
MARKVFVLGWDEDELGPMWMNKFNLELCLYSKEHTRRDLLTVTEVPEIADSEKVVYYSNI